MIEKILNSTSFGTKDQILYIIELVLKNSLTKDELYQACSSKDYSYNRTFNPIILFLSWLNIIEDADILTVSKEIQEKNFLEEITLLIIQQLIKEKKIENIIHNGNLMYSKDKKNLIIKNNLIHFDYSNFRNLFLEIGLFIKDSLVVNQFLINPRYINWFQKNVIPLLNEQKANTRTLKDLEVLQDKQNEIGYEAEVFVLEYEKKVRKSHPNFSSIKMISEINVDAGYDIISYKNDDSILLDKYIEVKSFNKQESFFWSRNEIRIAAEKKDNYFLYLVDRSKMNNLDYIPTIIQNPYKNVMSNDKWKKRIEKYYISV